ncbi:hypothetical protein HH303_05330 [Rhodospirillaceae bacterium KN72]|uniref:DUF6285 domain-containing protein n=1 Tax=Pacificispira spongiicola TaxID=2729598 RepID=A0A7Y0DYE4_9PROT|nr:DUF6285 domain-containing protein [Pacificispira spongiicola]NMM43887.1 hypothetical protein [Pacificispira spongiicola]
MTPDKPHTADLLRAAADVFRQELMPSLPEEKQLDALMILAALGCAERDLEDAGGLRERQARRMERILPTGATVGDLCAAIRNGDFDDPDGALRLYETLMEDVRDRLALVNPDYLKAADQISTSSSDDARRSGPL